MDLFLFVFLTGDSWPLATVLKNNILANLKNSRILTRQPGSVYIAHWGIGGELKPTADCWLSCGFGVRPRCPGV